MIVHALMNISYKLCSFSNFYKSQLQQPIPEAGDLEGNRGDIIFRCLAICNVSISNLILFVHAIRQQLICN